jgi:hypothetical protein
LQIPGIKFRPTWVTLDVSTDCDWKEVEALTLQSFRHFALKRMLLQL